MMGWGALTGCSKGRSWDVESDGFVLGPDTCPFGAIDVLDDFILDIG